MPHDTVTVERFYTGHSSALELNLIAGASGLKRLIREPTVNRPGLVLSGFTRYFAFKRLQVIGNAEAYFLKSISAEERRRRYKTFFSYKIPCVVFSRGLHPDKLFLKAAEQVGAPIFRCPFVTMKFINLATLALEMMFAPRGTEMGSMVDILGVGVIIRGESGIGKSESVLALLERGYSLVSDDIARIRLVEGRELVATSSETTRYHMEIRGIGIINVPAVFGVAAVRPEKRVDLVVTLMDWDKMEEVDRIGLEQQTYNILGTPLPHVTIPVRPGRDLARLIEVAALDQKLKGLGYNPAQEFNQRLIERMRRPGD